MCPKNGLFEPAVWLGTRVNAGDLAGWVHDAEYLAPAPLPVQFGAAGIIIARRLPALAQRGDTLFTTAVPA